LLAAVELIADSARKRRFVEGLKVGLLAFRRLSGARSHRPGDALWRHSRDQFVRPDGAGNLLRPDELTAARQIERSLRSAPGTVQV